MEIEATWRNANLFVYFFPLFTTHNALVEGDHAGIDMPSKYFLEVDFHTATVNNFVAQLKRIYEEIRIKMMTKDYKIIKKTRQQNIKKIIKETIIIYLFVYVFKKKLNKQITIFKETMIHRSKKNKLPFSVFQSTVLSCCNIPSWPRSFWSNSEYLGAIQGSWLVVLQQVLCRVLWEWTRTSDCSELALTLPVHITSLVNLVEMHKVQSHIAYI